jgi:hypothetical protein
MTNIKPDEVKSIYHYKGDKKKLIQAKIDHIIQLRKNEKEKIEKNFITPLKELIELGKEARCGRKTITEFLFRNRAYSKFMQEFFNGMAEKEFIENIKEVEILK